MPSRRRILAFAALAPLAAFMPALAAEPVPFDAEAFEAAQKAGRPILLHVTAPWCPICKAQKPILAALGKEPRFRDLVILTVDFDTQRMIMRRFDARSQSTLIAFKGEREVGRSVGETQPEWIESFAETLL